MSYNVQDYKNYNVNFQNFAAEGLGGRNQDAPQDDIEITSGIYNKYLGLNLKNLIATLTKSLNDDKYTEKDYKKYLENLIKIENVESLNVTGLLVVIKTNINCKDPVNFHYVEEYYDIKTRENDADYDDYIKNNFTQQYINLMLRNTENFLNEYLNQLNNAVNNIVKDGNQLKRKRLAEMAIRYSFFLKL